MRCIWSHTGYQPYCIRLWCELVLEGLQTCSEKTHFAVRSMTCSEKTLVVGGSGTTLVAPQSFATEQWALMCSEKTHSITHYTLLGQGFLHGRPVMLASRGVQC